MPEGDTVYRTARRLDEALAGSVLRRSDFRVPRFATLDLSGQTVEGVVSRGKHLLIRVGADSIRSHLKMEGSWHVYRRGARWRRPAYQARVVLVTDDVTAVGFDLADVDVVDRDREHELVDHLGPDLLGAEGPWPGWDAAEAVRRLADHPEAPVFVALLDQRNLAGLGNEYVNELCFLRGMLPTRPVARADLEATVALARRLMTANRDRARRVTTGATRRGRTSWVYGREGQPCLRCGTAIARTQLGRSETELRNAFWCPSCQS